MSIDLSNMRTITSVDADGRETKCDDNPAEELRRQFGELQKSLKALNHYTRLNPKSSTSITLIL